MADRELVPNVGLVCCGCNSILIWSETDLVCPKCGIIPKLYDSILDFTAYCDDNNILPNEKPKLIDYIFVFTKSVSVTDIQYMELFQLLQDNSDNSVVLNFCEDSDFSNNGLPNHCTALITRFEHSCRVISPCVFDLHSIVRNSGYIHSAGFVVYAKEWMEVDAANITEELKSYIKKTDKKYELYFYTDQPSTEEEKKVSGIAIDHQRTYIGTKFFHTEKHSIENELRGFCEDNEIQDNGGIIFVYKDMLHVKADYLLYPEQNDVHYMIVYHSICKKENPIHDLDEDRPYWAGIYTTPHALTCAMVNLARIKPGDIVYDPFSHMGTTAIEAVKFQCIVLGSDLNEPLGALDNYNFVFHENLPEVISKLNQLLQEGYHQRCYEIASGNIHKDSNEAFVNTEPIEKLQQGYPELIDYEKRLFYYMVRRYVLRYLQGIEQESELKDYISLQINKFQTYMEISRLNLANSQGWIPDENTSKYVDDSSIKSLRVGPIRNNSSKFYVFKADANRFPLNDNSVDAIIMDPPYGYGDDIESEKLIKLYENFIRESFRVLKPYGRFEMCMLDKVKTGKSVSCDTMTTGVIGLINKIAIEEKVKFTRQEVIPNVLSLNYWKSKHALNRAIVNLEIVKKI